MENRSTIRLKLFLGGALLGAFLLPFLAFGYSQHTTHPALTDEIVDFYNASFPDRKISYEEKQWLIKGSIDEDDNLRFFSHFYDPIYDRGLQSVFTAGSPTFSAKQWALGNTQKDFYNSQLTGYAAISGAESDHDFSYDRALQDYARGDKKRAFIAFGHVLHLLEDAGVPDHTRNDPHPPVLDLGSPYEHEMHKWNPENFRIVSRLIQQREKPVSLSNIGSYLDKVANYSNSNFFSKDTIFIEKYPNPTVDFWEYQKNNDKEKVVGYKVRENDKYALVERILSSIVYTIDNKTILDGYWDRLSKEVVVSGAGALRLFLEEAEKAREEYLAKAEQKKPSLWAQITGLFGFGRPSADVDSSLSSVSNDDGLTTLETNKVTPHQSYPLGRQSPEATRGGIGAGQADGDTNGDRKVSPSLSPILSPLPKVSPNPTPTPVPVDNLKQDSKININTADKEKLGTLPGIGPVRAQAIIDYRSTNGPFQKIEDIMNVSGISRAVFNGIKDQITVGDITPTPSPAPVVYSGGGGGRSGSSGSSGGGSSSSDTSGDTSGDTEEGGDTTGDTTGDTASPGDILINEIAWMGTAKSANDEWLELYNTTNRPINITGWTLKSLASPSFDPDITLSGTIPAGGYFLLERTDDDTVSGVAADQIYTGALSNNGENLELKDVSGNLIDFVDASSGWPAGDNSTKKTMQLVSSTWVTATPTPKAQNQSDPTAQNPSAITDLAASHSSPTITVNWTAPDPGTYSPASLSYDMRYSLTNLTASGSWDSATKVASSSLPSVAEQGAPQSASFDITYEYGQTYYFALRTKLSTITTCDIVMCSGVSNVATVSFPTALDDNSWAMFGKDQYHTSLATTAGPGETATISWEFDAGTGNNLSQPVADSDGNIYFGAANGSSGKIVKLNKNGVKQWEYATNVSIGMPAVLSDGTVYFGRAGAGGVLTFTALNSDGTNKWDYTGASTVENVTVNSKGEPYFVITGTSPRKLVVLDPQSGAEKFVKTTNHVKGIPVVLDDGTIITTGKAGGGSHLITKFSATGSQSWQVSTTESLNDPLSDPSYDTSTGTTYSAAGPKLFTISQNGSALNSTAITSSGYYAATTVAISSDTLYVGFNNTNPASGSLLYALNKSDLSEKWSFEAAGVLNKQLVVDSDGNVYFSTQNGKLLSLYAAGGLRWLIETGSSSSISPVLTAHGLAWGYGSKIVLVR